MFQKSIELFHRAQKTIPGGVNSPVRAFKSVGVHRYSLKMRKAHICLMKMVIDT
jgi:glutamate-1-semialdehyde aminotransferase